MNRNNLNYINFWTCLYMWTHLKYQIAPSDLKKSFKSKGDKLSML